MLQKKQDEWNNLSVEKKLAYLEDIIVNLQFLEPTLVETANKVHNAGDYPAYQYQGVSLSTLLMGGNMDKMLDLYRTIIKTGKPPVVEADRSVDGCEIVVLKPRTLPDKILDQKKELFIKKGKKVTQYDITDNEPGTVGILGPGNFESLGEILESMFLHGKTCVFKSNHVNRILTEQAYPLIFHKLVKDGYLGFVSGGIAPGAQMCG